MICGLPLEMVKSKASPSWAEIGARVGGELWDGCLLCWVPIPRLFSSSQGMRIVGGSTMLGVVEEGLSSVGVEDLVRAGVTTGAEVGVEVGV